jgi:hypothetical protein
MSVRLLGAVQIRARRLTGLEGQTEMMAGRCGCSARSGSTARSVSLAYNNLLRLWSCRRSSVDTYLDVRRKAGLGSSVGDGSLSMAHLPCSTLSGAEVTFCE